MSLTRAYLYAMMTGENEGEVNETEFVAGCNRFGIDNPTPIITKRLGFYGNIEEIEKNLHDLAK